MLTQFSHKLDKERFTKIYPIINENYVQYMGIKRVCFDVIKEIQIAFDPPCL